MAKVIVSFHNYELISKYKWKYHNDSEKTVRKGLSSTVTNLARAAVCEPQECKYQFFDLFTKAVQTLSSIDDGVEDAKSSVRQTGFDSRWCKL